MDNIDSDKIKVPNNNTNVVVPTASVLTFSYNDKRVELHIPAEDLFTVAHMLNALLQSQGIKSKLVFK